MTYVIMICIFLVGAAVGFLADRFFFSNSKPNGALIFKKINEDEASASVKLYEDRLNDTVKAKKVVLEVIRE